MAGPRFPRITRLIDERQLSRLAHVSVGKLQEWRRGGKLRHGIDYRFLDHSSRMLRFSYPGVLQTIWELGCPVPSDEPSASPGTPPDPRPRAPSKPSSSARRTGVNLDWGVEDR